MTYAVQVIVQFCVHVCACARKVSIIEHSLTIRLNGLAFLPNRTTTAAILYRHSTCWVSLITSDFVNNPQWRHCRSRTINVVSPSSPFPHTNSSFSTINKVLTTMAVRNYIIGAVKCRAIRSTALHERVETIDGDGNETLCTLRGHTGGLFIFYSYYL